MAELFDQARAYYESAASDPWHWAEDAAVLVWSDGSTIAFREELAEVLERLASGGLPPFRIIVLILAACRGKLPPSCDAGPVLHERVWPALVEAPPSSDAKKSPKLTQAWNDPANQEFSDLIARLRLLHQLPAEQRESPHVKAVLVETILERLVVSRVQPAREIAQALRDMPALRALVEPNVRLLPESAAAWRQLHAGLKEFSPLSFALRLRTGLDALPIAAEVEFTPSQRARQLLQLLRSDPEQEGLAKVARDIMAALYLPRSLSELDELASGGFADISNRGSLDRLLPSELANDDLTLAMRVALNEALYIRREPPSKHPPAKLAVLLDVGVRQWGLPRVFGTAVALAFIAKEERCTEVSVFRAGAVTVQKADLLSRNGLTDHLAVLEPYAHPGPALKPFFAHFANVPEMEAVLVTHRDCLADPDFQREVSDIAWGKFYVATVDRDGCFELFVHPHRSKPICRADIELASLFPHDNTSAPPATIARLKDRTSRSDLPLILSVKPFPFLLPIRGKIERARPLENGGGVAVLTDHRLVRWERKSQGCRTLIDLLPTGRTLWLGTTDHGKKVHLLRMSRSNAVGYLTCWDGVTGEVSTSEAITGRASLDHTFAHDGVLYILLHRKVSAWQLEGQRRLGTVELPHISSLPHGRYVDSGNGEWAVLVCDGTCLRLERLRLPPRLLGLHIKALFDREGQESGPWALTARGAVFSGEGDCIARPGEPVSFFRISEDGHRICLGTASSRDLQVLDLKLGRASVVPNHSRRSPSELAAELVQPQVVPPRQSVRVNLDQISFGPGRQPKLRSTKGQWHRVALVSRALRLVPLTSPETGCMGPVTFEPAVTSAELNLRLKVASWPDGSKAWLDDRGLLHLKNADPKIPEASLLLNNGNLAAWASDGATCGSNWFLHEPARHDARALMKRIEDACPR